MKLRPCARRQECFRVVPPRLPARPSVARWPLQAPKPPTLTVPYASLNLISRRPICAVPLTSRSGGVAAAAPHEIATSSECLPVGHGSGGEVHSTTRGLKNKKRTSMLWWCMPHSWNQPAGSTSRTTSGPQRLLGWAMRCTHQQLWTPQGLCWHWVSAASLPVHFKSSSQIWPVPWPAKPRAITAPPVRPSCRHLHTGMRLGR